VSDKSRRRSSRHRWTDDKESDNGNNEKGLQNQ
jgi:hypothetical protein